MDAANRTGQLARDRGLAAAGQAAHHDQHRATSLLRRQLNNSSHGVQSNPAMTADIRYALRLLARSPIFTLTSVLSLAIGIAASAAIFSLADAFLLRPRVGVAEPATLVDIGRSDPNGQGFDNFGYPALRGDARAQHALRRPRRRIQFGPEVMSLGDAQSSERVFAGAGVGQLLRGRRHAAGGGALLPRRRGPHARHASGRRPQPRVLAPALRRQRRTSSASRSASTTGPTRSSASPNAASPARPSSAPTSGCRWRWSSTCTRATARR